MLKRLARLAAFYAVVSIVINIAFLIYIATPSGHRFLRYEIKVLVANRPDMTTAVAPLVQILNDADHTDKK